MYAQHVRTVASPIGRASWPRFASDEPARQGQAQEGGGRPELERRAAGAGARRAAAARLSRRPRGPHDQSSCDSGACGQRRVEQVALLARLRTTRRAYPPRSTHPSHTATTSPTSMTLFAWQDAACGRWQVRGSERDVRRVAQGRRLQAQPLRRAFACRDAHRLPAHVRLLPRSMVKCPGSQQPMRPPAAAGAHRLRRPETRALAACAPKEAAAALWCLPKVAHAAAFGLPGPGYNGRVPPVPAEARCRRDNHSAAVPKGHLTPLFERVLRDFPEFSPVALSTDPYVAQHGQSGGP